MIAKRPKVFIIGMCLLALILFGCGSDSQTPDPSRGLTQIDTTYMVTPDEAYSWHLAKDQSGGTYSGSPSWNSYMTFIETKLIQYGVVGITKNKWTYNRWYTTDWPGNGQWTFTSDGRSVAVASYSAYSGSTTDAGITAPMIFYDSASPPPLASLAGKIVVFKTAPHPFPANTAVPALPTNLTYIMQYTTSDYEYRSDPDTFGPLYARLTNDVSINFDVWYQLGQVGGASGTTGPLGILRANGAAGGIVVFDQSYDRLAGMYQFGVPVPPAVSCPTLFLDRNAGSQVITDAKNGKTATLKLKATVEPTETYQLIGFLPGKNYGTAADEKIIVTSHTEGPSVSQENGALGVLAIVRYFSNIHQSVRPRTLMIYLDNRHYMPGMESAFAQYDWFTLHPEAKTSVVASVGTEHLGQVEYNEVGEVYAQTGRVETSFLWARNNPLLIDMAIDAVKTSKWPRCQVNCVERPGVNNLLQGVWYGLGGIARTWNIPGYATMGTQGGYWATTARISAFDKNLFYKQIATMSQLTGQLMVAKLIAIDPLWGTLRTAVNGLADTAFVNTSTAVVDKNAILTKLDSVFIQVKADSYQAAITGLQDARTLVTTKIVTASQTALLTQVDSGIAKLQAKL